jgi:hypothetical protein
MRLLSKPSEMIYCVAGLWLYYKHRRPAALGIGPAVRFTVLLLSCDSQVGNLLAQHTPRHARPLVTNSHAIYTYKTPGIVSLSCHHAAARHQPSAISHHNTPAQAKSCTLCQCCACQRGTERAHI